MIAELLHKLALQDERNEHKFYPRPSAAGPERCIRQLVYSGLNAKKTPLPGRTYHIFDDGNFHEELVLDWLRKSAFTVHSEQMVISCRAPMKSGHNDAVITDVLNIDRLLELKAINHFTFQRFWDGELPLDYLTQCAIYIDGLQQTANPELKEGILLIKNKNTSQYIELLMTYAFDTLTIISKTHSNGDQETVNIDIPNIVTDACDKFYKVLDYIERQTLPKRQYDIDHWRCQYCPYDQCWEGYEKEFLELKTDTMLPNEIADMVRYKKETSAHRLEMQKEEKSLTEQIKKIMKDAGIREGATPEYICKLSLKKSQKLDKHVIPQKIIDEATQISYYEKLDIRKIKEAK